MRTYCRVRISAPNEEEANTISKELVKRKLVAGTMIYNGKSHYWWDNQIVEKIYWNIGAFSVMENKDKIIAAVRELHSDICPIIALHPLDGNQDFLEWIESSVE